MSTSSATARAKRCTASVRGAKNETVAIMGRNGMGKTTLFKSLMGMLPTEVRQVAVAGRTSRGRELQRVAKGIAYVPQGRMIFPTLTVRRTSRPAWRTRRSRRIPDEIYALFPVLFDMRKRKGGNLSGGQQQQLAIARALVTEPEGAAARRADRRASSRRSSRTSRRR
jgi:urea transport system ATP-binding protein